MLHEMSNELYWLTLTVGVTALMAFPYVLNRIAVSGLGSAMSNHATDADVAEWVQRAKKAHANAVENLVLFAPAVLVVQMLNLGNSMTSFACALYFFSRLAHYLVYTAGIPVMRTLAFFGGWGGIVILVLRALGMM